MYEHSPPPRQLSAGFWAEIAPSEHLLELYGDEGQFLDNLHGFVAAGLRGGDAVIIIATAAHRAALEERLVAAGFDLATARRSDRYIDLDAEATLARFMVNGWPDADRFHAVLSGLLARARAGERPVRAFGEMVAIMWAAGQCGAVVLLEKMWHELCHREEFSLYCAYPRSGLTQDAGEFMREICAAHSRTIGEPLPA